MNQHTGGTWRAVLPETPPGGRNAIVSDDINDASYDKEAIDYGGTLIAEAVLQKNIPLLLAAPELLRFVMYVRDLLDMPGTMPPVEQARVLQQAKALLAKATAVAPTSAPPKAPAWP